MKDYKSESAMRAWVECVSSAFHYLYHITGETDRFWSGEAHDAFLREREEAARLANEAADGWKQVLCRMMPIGPGCPEKNLDGGLLPEDIIK